MSQLTRAQLHGLVWSLPFGKLSGQFGVSVPTLKNTCVKFDIPIPSSGHWAKVQAGKPTSQTELPPRSPGMSDEIFIGARYCWQRTLSDEELLGPLREQPTFPNDIAEIRDRVHSKIGSVSIGRAMTIKHTIVSRLLAQDDARREKQKARFTFSWEKPIFETAFEQRRLRLLNAVFLALARCGGKSELRGQQAREITVTIHQTRIFLTLDRAKPGKKESGQGDSTRHDKAEPLRLAIVEGYERVEEKAAWQLEEKLREEELERHRQERERQERIAQARIDRLLDEAASLRRAEDIRAYVDAVKRAIQCDGTIAARDEITQWARWAQERADTIDPVKTGRFLQRYEDDEPSDE